MKATKKKIGNKIVKILETDLPSLSIKIQFSDHTTGWLSLKHLFSKPKGLAAEILRGGAFEKCFIEWGALAWPNGFELCPDAMRQWFEEQHSSPKNKAA